jgi:hypothetical protein
LYEVLEVLAGCVDGCLISCRHVRFLGGRFGIQGCDDQVLVGGVVFGEEGFAAVDACEEVLEQVVGEGRGRAG